MSWMTPFMNIGRPAHMFMGSNNNYIVRRRPDANMNVIQEEAEEDGEEGEEIEEPQMSNFKKYARIILPHVGLILLSLTYVILGAFVFLYLESSHEMKVREHSIKKFNIHKERMLEDVWELIEAGHDPEYVEKVATEYVDNVTRILFEAYDTHYINAKHLRPGGEHEAYSWTYVTAVFFTATLLTTIGYGNLVPVTWHGRMFCVAYALFGVPLVLITVADLGKFLSENIVRGYLKYSKARKNRGNPYSAVPTSDPLDSEKLLMDLEYITIPMGLIVLILLSYVGSGALLFQWLENWELSSGFYFSFITMTTVGFGDIVPQNRDYYLLDLFYIFIGLAITTMCIDLVGLQYIRRIHYMGRKIQDARFALVNVGGKMVHVPDIMRYAMVLQQKYGHKKAQDTIIVKGAYAPKDLSKIRFIDYGALASVESLQSLVSAMFSIRSREQVV